jgi:hypothetical protein
MAATRAGFHLYREIANHNIVNTGNQTSLSGLNHQALTILAVWAIGVRRQGWLTVVSILWALAIGQLA